jgi:ankyrin repeat protein
MEKFTLHRYARRNWLWHSATSTLQNPPSKRDRLFQKLVTEKQLPFEFKPWPVDAFLGSPYLDFVGWAIVNNNPALIKSLEEFDSRFKFVDCLQDSVLWFEKHVVDHCISQQNLDAIAECDRGIWNEKIPVQGWLYSKMLIACRKGNLAILDLCRPYLERDVAHWSHFRAHLIFEAAGANQFTVFNFFLYSLFSPKQTHPILFRADYGGHLCNAPERAALMGHTRISRHLIQSGAIASNIFGLDPSPGILALSNAIIGGNSNVVEVLLDVFDITYQSLKPRDRNARPSTKAEGFCKAVSTGNMALVGAFLANGTSPLVPNDAGMCPYMQAIKAGHMEIVLLLFFMRGCGVKENITGLPLTMAAANGHSEIIDFLILNGADVIYRCNDTRNGPCLTPLYAASANGHYAVVKQILAAEAGADVSSPRDLLMISDSAGNEQYSSLYTLANKVRSLGVRRFLPEHCSMVWKHIFGAFLGKFQNFLEFIIYRKIYLCAGTSKADLTFCVIVWADV